MQNKVIIIIKNMYYAQGVNTLMYILLTDTLRKV